MTYQELKRDASIRALIERADQSLVALGFTEHSFAHVGRVADTARYILETMGYSAHEVELVQMAAYLHDIGNLVNRVEHSQSGAVMAFRILDKLGMDAEDIADIVTAIGNHDEGTGTPVNAISAALFLADKSDVRRSRVRNMDPASYDIHDRVNYSVDESKLELDPDAGEIRLRLHIDPAYSTVADYFEIFLTRMLLCKKAAEKLGQHFRLIINGQNLM
ncbi:MAG: HD domain-containing protein [Clostridiales bacterium]|nr:HD domain-containing protein [Clostridiales bacterium]